MCLHCHECSIHNCPLCMCVCWTHPFQCIDSEDCYNTFIENHITKLRNKFDDFEVNSYSQTTTSTPTTTSKVSTDDVIYLGGTDRHKKRLASNNKPPGKRVQSTSPSVHITPAKRQRRTSPIRSTSKSDSISSRKHTSAKVRSRTPCNTNKSLTNSTPKCKRKLDLDIPHKHKQQKNTARPIPKDTTDSVPIQTGKNVCTNNDASITSISIQNTKPSTSVNSATFNTRQHSGPFNIVSNSSMESTYTSQQY